MYGIRGVNYLHEEINSISIMLSFRSSMNVICTCFVGAICMNKILFKPTFRHIKCGLFPLCKVKYFTTSSSILQLHRIPGPVVIKNNFMLNSAEHNFFPANKC